MVYLAGLEGLSAPAHSAVTPITPKTDPSSHAGRGARRTDLAARLKGRLRALKTQLERRETLLEAIREANASLEPKKVAGWLVHEARSWVPAPCWVVVARDVNGDVTIVADEGLTPALTPSLWATANWVMRHGSEFLAADLARDPRAQQGTVGSAVGFPLLCRHRP